MVASPPNEVAPGWGVPDVPDEVCAWARGGVVGGARLNARPEEESVRNGFQHSHIMQPFPYGPETVPTVQCSVGAWDWGRKGGESDGTSGRTPLTCDGSVLGVGVGSTAGVDAAPPLDEAGGVNSQPVVLGGACVGAAAGVDAPAPNSSTRLRGCTAGVPGGGGGAAHGSDRRPCPGHEWSQARAHPSG